MDYGALRFRLINRVIGERDSLSLSRRLGYGFNQVERWRRGSKQCRWGEFWELCEVTGMPLPQTLHDLFAFPRTDEPSDFLRHLRGLHLAKSIEAIAGEIHVHAATLKRYFRGDTSCELEVVLRLIDLTPQALESFLDRFGVSSGPEIQESFGADASRSKVREWMGAEPVIGALLAALDLGVYRDHSHSAETLGSEVGLPAARVEELLKKMAFFGVITWDGNRYTRSPDFLQMEGVSREALIQFAQFWTRRSWLRLMGDKGEPITMGSLPNFFGFRIVALSREGERKVAEALRRCHQEILDIEAGDQAPKDDVRVILLQDFAARDVPESECTKMSQSDLKLTEK